MKKLTIILPFLILVGFSIIIAIPIGILSDNLSEYDRYNESISYEYIPDTPSTVESLNLNVEFGNVEFKYIDPPVNYFVKIDVYIEMAGEGLAGKNCFDFFNIEEGNLSDSPLNFLMKLKPGISNSEAKVLINNVSILVSLSKAIIFNISTTVINGKIELFVPFNVQINNINAQITSGDILLDLKSCILDGNITGIIFGNWSNIELRTYNIHCTKNGNWYFYNYKGEILLNISQSNEMGANITAIAELETAEAVARVFYNDFSSNIGATLYLSHWNSYFPDHCSWDGFDYIDLETLPEKSFLFTSFDFPSLNNYNITFCRNTMDSWRPYFWNIYSEPLNPV